MAAMTPTTRARSGIAVAPHALAARSAVGILRESGNAVEAMVAAAATVAAVYPHMNSIGGDAFWLVHVPGETPRVIDASGPAAAAASIDFYRQRGMASIPFRGGVAANTVAGTLSGWETALEFSREHLRGRMPLARLLEEAIAYARDGITVTASQSNTTAAKREGLAGQPGFDATFLVDGAAPRAGTRFVNAFIKQLGGSLASATSTSGTTFTVRLPVSILAE
jgi:gamma-glutamyltranspeptidase/glutathione hydrolase